MKSFQIAVLASSVVLASLTTGCATVTGGTTESLSVKTQKDSVDVTGATCTLSNSGGSYQVVTPGKVSVHREKDDLNVQCSKDGEAPAVASVQSSMRKGAIAGDVAWLGVLSFVSYGIDRANGSIFEYPDDVTVSFGTAGGQQSATDSAVPRASSPQGTTDSTASTNSAAPTQAN